MADSTSPILQADTDLVWFSKPFQTSSLVVVPVARGPAASGHAKACHFACLVLNGSRVPCVLNVLAVL